VQTITDDSALKRLDADWGVRIAVSSSARNGVVGMDGAMEVRKLVRNGQRCEIMSFSSTLGKRDEQNPYSGELAAMANALTAPPTLRVRMIVMVTRNKAAALTLRKLRQQSDQEYINRVYGATRALKRDGNTIAVLGLPSSEENELLTLAKAKAKAATKQGTMPQTQLPRTRSTTLNIARAKHGTTMVLPEKIGKYSKRIDNVSHPHSVSSLTMLAGWEAEKVGPHVACNVWLELQSSAT